MRVEYYTDMYRRAAPALYECFMDGCTHRYTKWLHLMYGGKFL